MRRPSSCVLVLMQRRRCGRQVNNSPHHGYLALEGQARIPVVGGWDLKILHSSTTEYRATRTKHSIGSALEEHPCKSTVVAPLFSRPPPNQSRILVTRRPAASKHHQLTLFTERSLFFNTALLSLTHGTFSPGTKWISHKHQQQQQQAHLSTTHPQQPPTNSSSYPPNYSPSSSPTTRPLFASSPHPTQDSYEPQTIRPGRSDKKTRPTR